MGKVTRSTAGIMLLFMTNALIHNANIPLTLCRGTQNSSRHKLIVRVPLVCDRQSGSEKRILHDYEGVSNRLAYNSEHNCTWNYSYTTTLTPFLQPAQTYKPHSLMDWNRKNNDSEKRPKVRKREN